MEQENNQQYIFDDKTGNVVGVEKANDKHKQQKLALKLKVAALCTAIGVTGFGCLRLLDNNNPEKSSEVVTEIEMNNREEALQSLINSGLTLEEAEKKLLAAEEKAANEAGALTELESDYAWKEAEEFAKNENGGFVNKYKDISQELKQQTNDYEQLAPKQVNTDNRELVIQSLVNSGLTLEEAEKKLLAAEEKAANEAGALTELESDYAWKEAEEFAKNENGGFVNKYKDIAQELKQQTNDYETIVPETTKEPVTEVSEMEKIEEVAQSFDYNSEIDKVLNGQSQVYVSADRAINNQEGINVDQLYTPSFENSELGAIYTQDGDKLMKVSLEQAENIVSNGGQVAMLVENEGQGIGYVSVGSENNIECTNEASSMSK